MPSPVEGAAAPKGAPGEARRSARTGRARRMLATVGVALVSALVVIGLGLLAEAAQAARAAGSVASGPLVVVAEPGETAWELARRVAPSAAGPELAALTERIVEANSLGSVRLQAGQLVQVPGG
jgi:hypothetical protein